jgi:hypothetical protein
MRGGEESQFGQLPAFPANPEPPLPPPRSWIRRLPGLIWRLFPATIVCIPLFGCFGLLLLGIVDIWPGFLGGLAIGAFVGVWIDVKRSLHGDTMDD